MAHSKKNATSAFFTAHERAELRSTWGSRSTRLTRESFLLFGSCNLCLLRARDPVSCPDQGHLFCRECAISNLLAQSKEIKRLKKEAERLKAETELQKELDRDERQIRELEDFENLQTGRKRKAEPIETDRDVKRRPGEQSASWKAGQLLGDGTAVKPIKERSCCPVTSEEQPHDFSLKSMLNVSFKEQKSGADSAELIRACPSCDKPLTNATKAVLARPCGHVLCKSCSDKFQKHTGEKTLCYVCQADLSAKDSSHKKRKPHGLIELRSDGTGFAGGGNNMVKREGIAFQVG